MVCTGRIVRGVAAAVGAPARAIRAGILLAEFANVIWKKTRRGEIADPKPYEAEFTTISEFTFLHSVGDLIVRATQMTVQIDHPVYDCLYIACAEKTESTLVTADQRLIRKIAESSLDISVHHIGESEFQNEIRQAATGLIVTDEKLSQLITVYEAFEATQQNVRDSLFMNPDEPRFEGPEEYGLYMDSPALKRLKQMVDEMTDEERVDLLALGSLGQGYSGTDWAPIFNRACADIGNYPDNIYLVSLATYWKKGWGNI